jgi:hypothetical protein
MNTEFRLWLGMFALITLSYSIFMYYIGYTDLSGSKNISICRDSIKTSVFIGTSITSILFIIYNL